MKIKNKSKKLSVLEVLNARVDFEIFRPLLEKIWKNENIQLAGWQGWDRVMMFKILILQNLYELSDDATEYHVYDRLDFRRFLGLQLNDSVPDAKTIWKHKEDLVMSGKNEELFMAYNNVLDTLGISIKAGRIVDATIIQIPQQEQNACEKDGETMSDQ